MGKVQCGDRRLPDVGVDMAGKRSEPGFNRVHALDDHGEIAALNDLLDQTQLFRCQRRILVPDGDGGGDIGLADKIRSELLQRGIGIGGLVRGIAVEQRRSLVGHHLLEDACNRLALGEPLPADLGGQLCGVDLVEHDCAGRPAIGEGEPVELVEQTREGAAGKADHGQRAQMRATEARLEPAS